MKIISQLTLILRGGFFIFLINCGGGSITTTQNSQNTDDIINQQNSSDHHLTTLVLTSDFASPSQLLITNDQASKLANTGVDFIGSGAIIKIFDEMIYILNQGFSLISSDNLQIVDSKKNFQTINQFSTGNGTNPHDVIVIDDQAFITLYNPELSNDNFIKNNNIDLIILDLKTGERINAISFEDFLNEDNAKHARASKMIKVDSYIYICLQDLDDIGADIFYPNAPGKLVRLDTNTLNFEVFELQGRNPFQIEYSEISKKLYITHLAYRQNPETEFGGLEILDEPKLRNGSFELGEDSIFIPDEEFGGYTENISLNDENIFVVASSLDASNFRLSSSILTAHLRAKTAGEFEIIFDQGDDIRAIQTNGQNHLWVGARELVANSGESSSPKLYLIDLENNTLVNNPLTTTSPVVSIAVGEL